jgi:hypothetical protein
MAHQPARMLKRATALIALSLLTIAPAMAADNANDLPPPLFKASLLCTNFFKGGEGGFCRSTMAKIEGAFRAIEGSDSCGYKGAVSKVTWTYRGQKDGKDLYHVARRFPDDTDSASTSELDVEFDGKRHVLFEDSHQRIVIELEPPAATRPTSRPG